jgi:hypothetical protein
VAFYLGDIMDKNCIICSKTIKHGFEIKDYVRCCGEHITESIEQYFKDFPERDYVYIRSYKAGE